MKRLALLFVAWASFMTLSVNVSAQWVEAYSLSGAFNGFHFTDSLHGWFSHFGVNEIVHTSDGGYTFQIQQPTMLGRIMYDVFFEDTLVGWCVGDNGGSGSGFIARTTDGGASWVQKTHPASQSIWGQVEQVGSSIWVIGSYDGASEYLLILKTSDGGTIWQLQEFPQIVGAVGLYIFDSLNFVVHGVGGLLSRTTDGGTSWVPTSLPSDYQVERVAFLDGSLGYAIATDMVPSPGTAFLYRTTDAGFTWNLHYSFPLQSGQKKGLSLIPGTNTIFVAGWLNSTGTLRGILKSTNAGATWDTVLQVGTPRNVKNLFTPDEQHGWAVGNAEIYRYDYVTPPSIQPISNKLIQFGETFTYQVEATGMGLEYSLTGQPSGLNIGNYSGLINGVPTEGGRFDITVAVQDTDANLVTEDFMLKVNRKPLFITNINDTVYTQFNYFYEQLLEAEDIDDDTLNFAAIELPAFLTLTQESSLSIYTAIVQGTPTEADTGYHNIKIEVNDGYGGSDTISWVLCVDNVTGVKDNQTFFEFKLNQNYPNPFNPTTKIKYTIPASLNPPEVDSPKERTFVQLIVYDLLGREAAVLVNEEKQPGVYEEVFDGSNLPSGVYLYRLTAGEFNDTKKLVLLK
jgi:photosystem II stability/assembly factor-like uncharacterized protein